MKTYKRVMAAPGQKGTPIHEITETGAGEEDIIGPMAVWLPDGVESFVIHDVVAALQGARRAGLERPVVQLPDPGDGDTVWREATRAHLVNSHGVPSGTDMNLLMTLAHGEAHMLGRFADGEDHIHEKRESDGAHHGVGRSAFAQREHE